jgi:hypothetical protein
VRLPSSLSRRQWSTTKSHDMDRRSHGESGSAQPIVPPYLTSASAAPLVAGYRFRLGTVIRMEAMNALFGTGSEDRLRVRVGRPFWRGRPEVIRTVHGGQRQSSRVRRELYQPRQDARLRQIPAYPAWRKCNLRFIRRRRRSNPLLRTWLSTWARPVVGSGTSLPLMQAPV